MKITNAEIEKNNNESVAGFGWYKRDEWELLLENSIDRNDMHKSYDEWNIEAEKRFQELKVMGINIHKIQISVPELIKWCKENKLPIDGSSKARYISMQVQKIYSNK